MQTLSVNGKRYSVVKLLGKGGYSWLVQEDRLPAGSLEQMQDMCRKLYAAGLNIDYPTNFIPCNGRLYYIDYECNDYMDQWNFENWGCQYWSRTEVFLAVFAKVEK